MIAQIKLTSQRKRMMSRLIASVIPRAVQFSSVRYRSEERSTYVALAGVGGERGRARTKAIPLLANGQPARPSSQGTRVDIELTCCSPSLYLASFFYCFSSSTTSTGICPSSSVSYFSQTEHCEPIATILYIITFI